MELTLEEVVLISEIALGIAGAGIIASMVWGIKYHRLAQVEPKLEQALDLKMIEVYTREEPKKRNYYNVRCHCGRFAKRLAGSDCVVICHKHEVVVDWTKIDIDWVYKPISMTEVGIEVDMIFLEMEEELPAITSPVQIIYDAVPELDIDIKPIDDRKLLLSHS